jgi:hypothetical protein
MGWEATGERREAAAVWVRPCERASSESERHGIRWPPRERIEQAWWRGLAVGKFACSRALAPALHLPPTRRQRRHAAAAHQSEQPRVAPLYAAQRRQAQTPR